MSTDTRHPDPDAQTTITAERLLSPPESATAAMRGDGDTPRYCVSWRPDRETKHVSPLRPVLDAGTGGMVSVDYLLSITLRQRENTVSVWLSSLGAAAVLPGRVSALVPRDARPASEGCRHEG